MGPLSWALSAQRGSPEHSLHPGGGQTREWVGSLSGTEPPAAKAVQVFQVTCPPPQLRPSSECDDGGYLGVVLTGSGGIRLVSGSWMGS